MVQARQIINITINHFLNVKKRTLTQLLGNNMRAEYVYVKVQKIEIMYNTYYLDSKFDSCDY
jgi:hypothetical protein